MAVLKTNYVDDVLNASVNEKRKYNMIQNADGTVSFDDVTTYTQNGDSFGAKDINDTNTAVNVLNENLTIDGDYKFKVGKDGDGNVCYYGADGSLIPFKSTNEYKRYGFQFICYRNSGWGDVLNISLKISDKTYISFSTSGNAQTGFEKKIEFPYKSDNFGNSLTIKQIFVGRDSSDYDTIRISLIDDKTSKIILTYDATYYFNNPFSSSSPIVFED